MINYTLNVDNILSFLFFSKVAVSLKNSNKNDSLKYFFKRHTGNPKPVLDIFKHGFSFHLA